MGFMDGLLGGVVGAGMASVVKNVLEKHGGVQGVVSEFEKNGLGATVKSWVSTGPKSFGDHWLPIGMRHSTVR